MSKSAAKLPISRQRRTVTYQGRVQGVGFRYSTQRIAAGYAVAGFVQNLPDGRVLLVCEGAAEELDRFVRDVAATLERYIGEAHSVNEPATGEFEGFTIRR